MGGFSVLVTVMVFSLCCCTDHGKQAIRRLLARNSENPQLLRSPAFTDVMVYDKKMRRVRLDRRRLQNRRRLPETKCGKCGHSLKRRSHSNIYDCDVCGGEIPGGTRMYDCRRCNWGACRSCFKNYKRDAIVIPAMPSRPKRESPSRPANEKRSDRGREQRPRRSSNTPQHTKHRAPSRPANEITRSVHGFDIGGTVVSLVRLASHCPAKNCQKRFTWQGSDHSEYGEKIKYCDEHKTRWVDTGSEDRPGFLDFFLKNPTYHTTTYNEGVRGVDLGMEGTVVAAACCPTCDGTGYMYCEKKDDCINKVEEWYKIHPCTVKSIACRSHVLTVRA